MHTEVVTGNIQPHSHLASTLTPASTVDTVPGTNGARWMAFGDT